MHGPLSRIDSGLEHDCGRLGVREPLKESHSDLVRGLPRMERRGSDGEVWLRVVDTVRALRAWAVCPARTSVPRNLFRPPAGIVEKHWQRQRPLRRGAFHCFEL